MEFTPAVAPAGTSFYRGKAFPELTGKLLIGCLRGESILQIGFEGTNAVSCARLLMARMFAYRGDASAARSWLAEVRDAERGAGARLAVSDRILAEMVELSVDRAGPERWADLCTRSLTDSLEQEPIEVHEAHALAALRAGRPCEAEDALRELIDSAPYGAHHYELQADDRLVFTGANRAADRILGVDHRQFGERAPFRYTVSTVGGSTHQHVLATSIRSSHRP